MREQLDKENSRCKKSGQIDNGRRKDGTEVGIVDKIVEMAGHMVRMIDKRLQKEIGENETRRLQKMRRPQLRWEDCPKKDLRKAEEEEKWRENTSDGKNNNSSRTAK